MFSIMHCPYPQSISLNLLTFSVGSSLCRCGASDFAHKYTSVRICIRMFLTRLSLGEPGVYPQMPLRPKLGSWLSLIGSCRSLTFESLFPALIELSTL